MVKSSSTRSRDRNIQVGVQRAVRLLRERLGKISQTRLAEMVGRDVTLVTVSRWENGKRLPFPRNRQKLAEIALEHNWWDIAAALDVEVPIDEWLSALEMNCPQEYREWMAVGMVTLYGFVFEPDDPHDPTQEEIDVARKYSSLTMIANDLLDKLVGLHNAGKQMIAPPPNEHFRRFWQTVMERTKQNG